MNFWKHRKLFTFPIDRFSYLFVDSSQKTIGYVDTVPLWYNHKKYGSNIQNKIELAAGNSGQLEQCEWNRTNKIDSMNNLVKDSFNFIGKIQRIFRIFSTSLFLWIWTDWSIVGQICYMWCALCIPHVNGINQLNLLFCSNDWWSIGVFDGKMWRRQRQWLNGLHWNGLTFDNNFSHFLRIQSRNSQIQCIPLEGNIFDKFAFSAPFKAWKIRWWEKFRFF